MRVIHLLLNEEKAKINIDTLMGAKVDFKRELHNWFVEKMNTGSCSEPPPPVAEPKKIKLVLKRKSQV